MAAMGVFISTASAFVAPTSLTFSSSSSTELHALPMLSSSSTFAHIGGFLISVADDIGIEEAFKDDIQFLDPTIKLELGIFGVVVLLLVTANALLGQMDNAIEKVLGDFERAMKSKYASRWIEIEEELEGLEGAERTQKLGAIMERMQNEEPQLMERVNADMASY